MNRSLVILGLCMASLIVSAQRVQVDKPTVNVGKTGFEVPVTATFELKNRGGRHLTVTSVKPDCGCTKVEYPRKSVGGGETFKISLTYDARMLGHFRKQAAIYVRGSKEPVWLTMEGVIRVGTLSVFMSYAVGMLEPVQGIINSLSALISIQVNIERFTGLLAEESDVKDSPQVIEKYGDHFHAKRENWEPLYGDVEFEDVSFQYPDGNEMVLEHFSLKVPRGTNIAIVGETGAGKSTLVNLACRFYEPTMGRVLIDGRDVRERSQLWLHSNIGYVLQTPYLFSGSVRDNLRYGRPDATDEQIREALHMASADFVVDRMEKGLDSDVGEGGSMLSTGEKQLISIARAILADPRILVLDEATSSVDTVTERAIQDAIAAVIRGRTSFVIAHRLSTIVGADVILAVQDGRILERGTHRELMRQKGYYYQLFTRQYEESVWAE